MLSKKMLTVGVVMSLLSACVGKDRSTASKLRTVLIEKKYVEANKLVNDKDFYSGDRNELLRELEKGTVYYLQGNYKQALDSFGRSQKISDRLFTVSMSKKLAKGVSASLDNYYGERYERSLIRFYESLTHYNLYKNGKYETHVIRDEKGVETVISEKILTDSEKRVHLMAARAVITEWDTLLGSYKEELAGKATYKVDLTAKLWGAYIHKETGISTDRQIALQLYKDAKDVLLKNYNAYPTYNTKYKEFDKNFSELASMPLDKVKVKYIEDNNKFSEELLSFINDEIRQLQGNSKNEVVVLLKESLISPKKAKRVVIGFTPSLELGKTAKDGTDIIFVPLPASSINAIPKNFIPILFGAALPTFEFEIPSIPERVNSVHLEVALVDKDKKTVATFPLVITNPVDDIARKAISDKFASQIAETAVLTTAKHVAAIIMAKKGYDLALSKAGDNKLGQSSAVIGVLAAYKAASIAINESARADLRQWSTLPQNIRMGSVAGVKDGEYNLIINTVENNSQTKHLYNHLIKVENGKAFVDVNML
jgi:hypothetical protein